MSDDKIIPFPLPRVGQYEHQETQKVSKNTYCLFDAQGNMTNLIAEDPNVLWEQIEFILLYPRHLLMEWGYTCRMVYIKEV